MDNVDTLQAHNLAFNDQQDEQLSEEKGIEKQQKTCPHLGKEFHPFVNPLLDNPYPFYKHARNEEPIFFSSLLNAYVLTRYEDVLTVLKDPVRFSSAQSLQSVGDFAPETIEVLRQGFPVVSLIGSDGEQHRRFRAPFLKAFATEKLVAMEGSTRAIANRLVDNFINDGQVEILSKFAYPLPLEVIFNMYGVPLNKMAEVKHWGSEVTALFSTPLTPERQVECARSYVDLQHFMARLVEERHISPNGDMISDLLTSDLTVPEIVLLLCEMIVAGHKTTANLIGKALKLLLEQPELWQSLCDEPSLIPIALEEVLRYDTPAASMIRVTTQEVSLAGATLPKDTRILLLYGSANRDENQYPDSDRFNIERFKQTPVNHLAFSHGVHHCTGSNLARREGRIALEVLSSRLPNLRLRPNQQLTHIPALLNRGYAQLYLEWDRA
ncbi:MULTISPECIES: cytochrome P450 [Nostocales]|uniref:Cytochrome P450 n=3 Tax=Nostocales TaxID=1161 RepID=A0A8S9T2D0_9CYAN|nr:cytochrome P450 [Tolypothrix bouteillei]KAF3885732.1 cytochrome P450 [Tolypothrix bouteillei VB521301]